MKTIKTLMALALSALMLVSFAGIASANVPGVALTAPPPPPAPNAVTMGTTQPVTVFITHKDTGSPPTHYVDHIMLFNGDKMVKEWKYDKDNAVKDLSWQASTDVKADSSNMDLKAVSHCTEHGYQLQQASIPVQKSGMSASELMKVNMDKAGTQISGAVDQGIIDRNHPQSHIQLLDRLRQNEMQSIKKVQDESKAFLQSQQGQRFIQQWDQKMGTGSASPMTAPIVRK